MAYQFRQFLDSHVCYIVYVDFGVGFIIYRCNIGVSLLFYSSAFNVGLCRIAPCLILCFILFWYARLFHFGKAWPVCAFLSFSLWTMALSKLTRRGSSRALPSRLDP